MTPFAIAFLLMNAALLLSLPRTWAPLPLLVAVAYMTNAQRFDAGPFTFTVVRVLLFVGILRIVMRGERPARGFLALDWLMVTFGAWAVLSSAFHQDPTAALVFHLGLTYNALGCYFLLRCLCQSPQDAQTLCRITVMVLAPVAIEMVQETVTRFNLFSVLGGVPVSPVIREGRVRAQGPFAHAILAGSIGAVSIPLAVGLWRTHRTTARVGLCVAVAMVIASASSGPLMSAGAAAVGLFFWRYRYEMRRVRWMAVATYVALDMVMKAPAYYLIARIDLVGGSGGWHRARMIEVGLTYLNEWWLTGTDYTRHWMPTGVTWSPDHTDITNYFLGLGVLGGLPLTLLFVAVLAKAFSYVGDAFRRAEELDRRLAFLAWAFGASLFSHTVTMLGISYFDQSFVFLFAALAAIVATSPARSVAAVVAPSRIAPPGAPVTLAPRPQHVPHGAAP